MKKTFALLVALMLLVAMLPTSAMAYTAPTLAETPFEHTLALTYALDEFDSDDVVIGYKYTVGDVQAMNYTDENNYEFVAAKGVTGSPSIIGNYESAGYKGYVVFDKDSVFDANKVSTVEVKINWDNVQITEPGIYVWPLTKALDTTITSTGAGNATDKDTERYLYVIVTRDGNALSARHGISDVENLNNKGGDVADQYPVDTVNLEIKKEISGNMASANQYFRFDITIKTTPGEYSITNIKSQTDPNVYDGVQTNDTLVEVLSTGTGTATIWLKAGESAKIENLPYGSQYTIVETGNNGYQVAATMSGNDTSPDTSKVNEDYTVSDNNLTADATVTYTNTKNATTPTGVVLNTAAPVMGILLALSLLAVLFIGKRKEYQA